MLELQNNFFNLSIKNDTLDIEYIDETESNGENKNNSDGSIPDVPIFNEKKKRT